MSTVQELLKEGYQQLSAMENTHLEAQILLAFVLNCDRIKLIAWPDLLVREPEAAQYRELIVKRKAHEPIAYLVGSKEFWSLPFRVNNHTLIPRSQTELLIEIVLNQLPATPLRIVDVGSGSGIIACTLAHMRPMWQIIATDISEQALLVAKGNAETIGVSNIQFKQTTWCVGLEGSAIDAIVSNPPYIKEGDPHLTQGDLAFEPQPALIGGASGLEAFSQIIMQAANILKPGGLIAFEHGYDQAKDVESMLLHAGFNQVNTYADLAHIPRVTIAHSPLLP